MSTDPWFDWWIDYGSFDGFSHIPPELAALASPNGIAASGWRDQEGNVVLPSLLPPLPPSAPACAQQAYQDWLQLIGNLYLDAINSCDQNALAFGFNRLTNYDGPPFLLRDFVFAPVSFGVPYWNDPCSSSSLGYPSDCDYFLDFFSGFFRTGCPEDYRPTTLVSPAVHRLIAEIIKPTGKAFLWRLAYDQPVFWPVVFRAGILIGNNRCQSFALAILLQLEALQDLINEVSTETCFIQFGLYFDGILEGRRYTITDENGTLVGSGLVGYNRTLELAFCLKDRIFRDDVGKVSCDEEEDSMGCDCDQIRQIIREEIERIEDNYLNPIKVVTEWLNSLFRPLEEGIRLFFGNSDSSWSVFLGRYNLLSAYIRPSETDEDTVILPTLTDRIEEGFSRNKIRQRIIYSCVNATIRVSVRVSVEGERITTRDTWIQPDAIRPYNHYGQLWLVYQIGAQPLKRTAWQWIRSRDHELFFVIPDFRQNSADTVQVSAEYQLFAGLRMQSGYPTLTVLMPELGSSDLWTE